MTSEELDSLDSTFDLARSGDTDALIGYVDAVVPVNLTNGRGDTLLLLAAYHQRPDLVHALLKRDADPGRVNDRGAGPSPTPGACPSP